MTTTTRYCIFAMDGVLIDSGAHHRNAWQALLEELDVRRAGMRAVGVTTADELEAAGAETAIPHFEGLDWNRLVRK